MFRTYFDFIISHTSIHFTFQLFSLFFVRWRCAIATQHSHQIALLIFANYRFIKILTAYKLVHSVALLRWSFDVFVKIASLNVDVGEKV